MVTWIFTLHSQWVVWCSCCRCVGFVQWWWWILCILVLNLHALPTSPWAEGIWTPQNTRGAEQLRLTVSLSWPLTTGQKRTDTHQGEEERDKQKVVFTPSIFSYPPIATCQSTSERTDACNVRSLSHTLLRRMKQVPLPLFPGGRKKADRSQQRASTIADSHWSHLFSN